MYAQMSTSSFALMGLTLDEVTYLDKQLSEYRKKSPPKSALLAEAKSETVTVGTPQERASQALVDLPEDRYPALASHLLAAQGRVSSAEVAEKMDLSVPAVAGMLGKLTNRLKKLMTPEELKSVPTPIHWLVKIDYVKHHSFYELTPLGREVFTAYLEDMK